MLWLCPHIPEKYLLIYYHLKKNNLIFYDIYYKIYNMSITNINSFLSIIESINSDIDNLLSENVFTGDTLSGTSDGTEILGTSAETEEEMDKIRKNLDENFILEGDPRDDEVLYLSDEELKELIGEDGAEAVKELSESDLKNLLLLQATPKAKGYILRTGSKAGRIVLRTAIKGGKIARGLVLAGQLNTSLLSSKNSKVVGFCFCKSLADEFENSPNPSSGSWGDIKDNINTAFTNEEIDKYDYDKLKYSIRECEDEFGSSITDKTEREDEGKNCDRFNEVLDDFESSMSAIISALGKYFSIRDKEKSKNIKRKGPGAILSNKDRIDFKFTSDADIEEITGGSCNTCLNTGHNSVGPSGLEEIEIVPLGSTSEDNVIKCKWNKQGGSIDYITMRFEKSELHTSQDVSFEFYKSGARFTHRVTASGRITHME